jgi:uncharacterized protein (DUF302 family)
MSARTEARSHRRPPARPRRRAWAGVAVALLLGSIAAPSVLAQDGAAGGVMTIPSAHDFSETLERLEQAIDDEGLMLVLTIDHAANADDAGLDLPPTTLLLFGNPEAGTPLMQTERTMALDLPQKMLVWEDDAGDVFVTWRDPIALAAQHGVAADAGALPNIAVLLERLARTAAGPVS